MIPILVVAVVVTLIVAAIRRYPRFLQSGNLDPTPIAPPQQVQTQAGANSSNTPAPAAPQKWLDKVRSFKLPKDREWKLPVVVVACEMVLILVCRDWLWPLLWGFFGIWFFVFNVVVVAVYIFCREAKDKKKPDDGEKLTTVGKWILVAMVVAFLGSHFDNQPNGLTASAKHASSAVADFFSNSALDDRKEKTLRDFLARNKTDNPEVLTRLIRTAEMWPTMIGPRSRVVDVPATGLSEKIPIGKTPMLIRPSEDMILVDDHGREYPVSVINPNWDFPHPTEWVRYRSVSGKPAIVLVSP